MGDKENCQTEKEEFIETENVETENDTFQLQVSLTRWRRLVTVLGLLTVILLISLLTLTILWREARLKSIEQKEHHLCVPCDEKTGENYNTDKDFFTKTMGDNTTICCPKASTVLDKLIQRHAKENFWNNSASRLLSTDIKGCTNRKPKGSISISGILKKDMQPGTSEPGLIHWKNAESITSDIFRYHNGHLSVTKPGFYHIFSHIKLQRDQADTVHSHSIHIKDTTDGTNRKVLENSKSLCGILSEGEISSTVGAVFKLHENNTVHVKTSHPHLLASDQSNAFELYLI